jgi:hypothetical protein
MSMECSDQTCVAEFMGVGAKRAFGKSSLELTPNIKATTEIFTKCIKQLYDTC